MKAKFKKGQVVRIVGRYVPPELKYKTGKIKKVEQIDDARIVRYIIPVKGTDRFFYQDELELETKRKDQDPYQNVSMEPDPSGRTTGDVLDR